MGFFKDLFSSKNQMPDQEKTEQPPSSVKASSPAPIPQSKPQPQQQSALSQAKNILAISSAKGGVGKSTVASQLAVALRASGFRVGILDADIYGPSQPTLLGGEDDRPNSTAEGRIVPVERHGISFVSMGLLTRKSGGGDSPVILRAPMAMKIIHEFLGNVEWGVLDYLLIDLPPGTGDVQLTLAQQASLTGAIIVTTPQEVALGIARRGLKMFEQLQVPIVGVIENMSGFTCLHCGKATQVFKAGGGKSLAQGDVPLLGAIPLDPKIMLSGEEGMPLVAADPNSDLAQQFIAIASKLHNRVQQLREQPAAEDSLSPTSFSLSAFGGLQIAWADGKKGEISARDLRVNCGCALCVDENTGKRVLDESRVAENVRVESVQPVGHYALGLRFSDGHTTGIFSFKGLRTLRFSQPTGPIASSSVKSSDLPTLELGEFEVRRVLDEQINPGVASHGGKIELVSIESGRVSLRMSGGCQGCSAAQLTLRQGVEQTLKKRFPALREVVDVTDHRAGENPYHR